MAVVAPAAMAVMDKVAVGVIDRQPYRWVSRGLLMRSLDPSDSTLVVASPSMSHQ